MMDNNELQESLDEIKREVRSISNGMKAYEKSIIKDLLYVRDLIDKIEKELKNPDDKDEITVE